MHLHADRYPLQAVSEDSATGAVDPRARLAVALSVLLAVIASSRPWLPLAVALLCLASMFSRRVPVWATLGRLAVPLAMALLVAAVRIFSSGSTVWFVWELGPWQLTASREGLAAGVLIGSRMLAGVAVVLQLSGTIPFDQIVAALGWFRLPKTCLEIALLMHRYIHCLFEQATEVVAAQRIRLGYAGLYNGLQSLGDLAGIVLLRSMEQAERTYEAMVARAGDGTIPLPAFPPVNRETWLYVALRTSLIVTAFLAVEGGW